MNTEPPSELPFLYPRYFPKTAVRLAKRLVCRKHPVTFAVRRLAPGRNRNLNSACRGRCLIQRAKSSHGQPHKPGPALSAHADSRKREHGLRRNRASHRHFGTEGREK